VEKVNDKNIYYETLAHGAISLNFRELSIKTLNYIIEGAYTNYRVNALFFFALGTYLYSYTTFSNDLVFISNYREFRSMVQIIES